MAVLPGAFIGLHVALWSWMNHGESVATFPDTFALFAITMGGLSGLLIVKVVKAIKPKAEGN